ncbi:hypothetical protein ACVXG9_11145 [Escherichia coli]
MTIFCLSPPAHDPHLQCALPAATSAIPIGAHIVSKVQTLLASQRRPGRTLRAARSVDALHAAFNQ